MQLNALFCSLWRNVEASCHRHFRRLLSQKTAAYYHSLPAMCHNERYAARAPLATVDNNWLVAAFTALTKARYRLRIAISAYPTCIRHPRKGDFHQNIATPFGMEELEWCGYQMVKNFDDMFVRFDMIHERDRHTDRRTDGRTDRHHMTA